MSHVRQQIREAAVTALGSIGTVYASRTLPIESADLPAVLVYTNDEKVTRTAHGAIYSRELELLVEARAKGAAVDDAVDDLVASIETALNQSTLGGLCKPLALDSIAVTVNTDGATPIAAARLTYRAMYFTEHGAPEAAL